MMKSLNQYIQESFKIGKNKMVHYNYYPETKEELKKIVMDLLISRGPDANLNDIDTSKITDMSKLFTGDEKLRHIKHVGSDNIKNIDISQWNTGNVTDMSEMFSNCYYFNSNISNWDVSQVVNMSSMFNNCICFNSDISNWDIHNVESITFMFNNCEKFSQDISCWDMKKIKDIGLMFNGCYKLKGDYTKWNKYTNIDKMYAAFYNCNKKVKRPDWYDSKIQERF